MPIEIFTVNFMIADTHLTGFYVTAHHSSGLFYTWLIVNDSINMTDLQFIATKSFILAFLVLFFPVLIVFIDSVGLLFHSVCGGMTDSIVLELL
jgi:hypothetical protein